MTTNSFLAFPFLSVNNGVVSFWISDDETLDISIADLGLASVSSIVMFENDSTITIDPGTIDYNWFNSDTPASGDYILFSDISDGGVTKKATVADLVSGSGAPADATYVVLSSNGTLTNEAVLTAGTGISLSTATVSVDFASVQAKDATLTSIALLGTGADKMIYTTGVDTWAEADITSAGRAILDDATASDQRTTLGLGTMATQSAASVSISGGSITGITDLAVADGGTGASDAAGARTNLGLVIGTDVQAYDAELAALAGLTSAADKGIQFTGAGTAATYDLTAAGKALLDDADAAAQRTTLGLGTLATQSGTFSGTSSGTNTGDQNVFSTISVSGQSDVVADSATDTLTLVAGSNVTITTNAGTDTITISASGGGGGLSDTDYGDITVSGSGTVMTIDNDVVTYAKMQNVSATDKLLGRSTAGSGDVEEITCTAAGRALLDDADAAAQRTTLGLGTLATQSGTFSGTSSGTNTGDQTITLTSDVTGSGTGSFATTIAAGAVSLSKMADMATASILGRNTAGTGSPEVLSAATTKTLLSLNNVENTALSTWAGTTNLTTLGTVTTGTWNATVIGLDKGGTGVALTDPNADRVLFWDDSAGQLTWLTMGTNLTITGTTLDAAGGGGGVSDGDKGDISVSSSGTVWTVDNDAITYAKIQNVSATDKILGRSTAGAGDIEEIDCTAAGRALLDDASASAQRTTLGVGTGDSPEFTAVNIGHASDTTVSRASAGDISVEGNIVYRAGGTDVPVTDGGTGSSTAAGARVNLLPSLTGNTLKVLRVNAGETDVEWSTAGGGSGDVTGPGSATDNAVARFDGTGGKTLQNSVVVIDDDGEIRSSIDSGACTGVIQSVHWCMLTADYTLTNTTSEQKLFNTTTNGTLTLPTGVYYYEAFIYLTGMSASSGNMAFDPVGAGTAVTDRWGHKFIGIDNSNPLNAGTATGSAAVTQQSVASIVTAGTGTGMHFQATGMFRISTGGTIIPSGTLVTGAAPAVKAGSWFRITRMGADSETYVGAWT